MTAFAEIVFGATACVLNAAARRLKHWLLAGLTAVCLSASAPATAETTNLKVESRFGPVLVATDPGDCCSGSIRFQNQKIDIKSAGDIYPSLEGNFRTPEGDVIVISIPAGARGMPPGYFVLLITASKMVDLAENAKFTSGDGTFRATQKGNEIAFDLGWENRKRKTAFYRGGVLYVGSDSAKIEAALSKTDCAYVLTTLASCQQSCPTDGFMDMSVQRNFNSLEEKPTFKADNFFKLCEQSCKGSKVAIPTARKMLCGY